MSREEKASDVFQDESEGHTEDHNTPGTLVLVLIFLACFAVYYFANWKALADVWWVR